MVALLGVFVVGKTASARERWYSFGGDPRFSPVSSRSSALILAIATFCGRRNEGLTMNDVIRLLCMAVVPLALIVKQPDLGTAIIIVLIVAAMMVIAGVPPRFMTLLAVVGSVGVVSCGLPRPAPEVPDRPLRLLPQSELDEPPRRVQLIYEIQQRQERHRLGRRARGGSLPRRFTVLGYVPEQWTDFIFTAIGEQLGFIGSALIIALLGFISYRMFIIGKNAKRHDGTPLLHRGVHLLRLQHLREHRDVHGHHAGHGRAAAAAQLRRFGRAVLLRGGRDGAVGLAARTGSGGAVSDETVTVSPQTTT